MRNLKNYPYFKDFVGLKTVIISDKQNTKVQKMHVLCDV